LNSLADLNIIQPVKFKNNETCTSFIDRHIGPRPDDIREMLELLGFSSLEELVDRSVPSGILTSRELSLPEPLSESDVLALVRKYAAENRIFRSFIGMGYSDCITPPVIQRNILENPGWYTQYTPYQAEISQGRLEALINFQTMITDLTGLELANASLLDEATAAAEAMTLCSSARGGRGRDTFFAAEDCHPQTLDVLRTRAEPLGIKIEVGDVECARMDERFFGALVQYPATDGRIRDFADFAARVRDSGSMLVVAADLLSLALLSPPGEWGADIAVGNTQRFGVPMGFGGPHAAYFATREEFKRLIPGRVVGVSRDSADRPAYRLALQTREQHIRRERATSNICTSQVLLAIMASFYGVYHGPDGIRAIARHVHRLTVRLAENLETNRIQVIHRDFFDTIRFLPTDTESVLERAESAEINLRRYPDRTLGISLDEVTTEEDVERLTLIITGGKSDDSAPSGENANSNTADRIPDRLRRTTPFMTHEVFNRYHSETELLRYIHRLQSRDLSLTSSMIPLGSCTMKLNAAVEMLPITWPEWTRIHPFVPENQVRGYRKLIEELESMLCEITGMDRVSLQPNSGAQGEYSGLMTIRRCLQARGETDRCVCLIPKSAHGTNPASAVMAGMKVVAVACDDAGNIDLSDLEKKIERYRDTLAAIMVTYPSTHGVFEETILDVCRLVHEAGGLVYMDGANMNALVGLCRPGEFGVDVCHLNLHKTFAIPHGGGGPGAGPIAVTSELAPYLPGHFCRSGGEPGTHHWAVSAAPWGSASILPISWAYIRLMGSEGLKKATQVAILNANYIARRLVDHFSTLYAGVDGLVAHECILDCRSFKKSVGITVADIAKRLMDYGFHAPTISWPVVETMMVEPTESESREELDRFCDALIAIRKEIREIEQGKADRSDNVLKNAPHTAETVVSDQWDHPYSREKAAYPVPGLREHKFWTICGRIDDTYGDRHLFCTCIDRLTEFSDQ